MQYCDIMLNTTLQLLISHGTNEPRRQNDRAIMDLVLSTFQSVTELKVINRVRVMHGVITLSNISTANGQHID